MFPEVLLSGCSPVGLTELTTSSKAGGELGRVILGAPPSKPRSSQFPSGHPVTCVTWARPPLGTCFPACDFRGLDNVRSLPAPTFRKTHSPCSINWTLMFAPAVSERRLRWEQTSLLQPRSPGAGAASLPSRFQGFLHYNWPMTPQCRLLKKLKLTFCFA